MAYVWHYRPSDGALIGSEPAEYDPCAPGRLLIPAHATATPAPIPRELDRWPHWSRERGAWEIKQVGRGAPADVSSAPLRTQSRSA